MTTPEQIHPPVLRIEAESTYGVYERIDAGYLGEGPGVAQWHFPVGEGDYPPDVWYSAQGHNPSAHTGLDLNLDIAPRGDIERDLDLSVFAIADGVVHYATQSWSGVGMVVIRHEHEGQPLYVRYAHIDCYLDEGFKIEAGDDLGEFADWRTGDHLHFDMALDPFSREWLSPGIRWVDPIPVLKAHLDPVLVDAMVAR